MACGRARVAGRCSLYVAGVLGGCAVAGRVRLAVGGRQGARDRLAGAAALAAAVGGAALDRGRRARGSSGRRSSLGGDRGRGAVVERARLPRGQPGAARPARRARGDRRADRRRGPDPDDRVPALRRAPLPPRRRPRGGLGAAPAPGAAARAAGRSTRGDWADTDELELGGLLVYRTLVLRRSPVQSRPPSPYELDLSRRLLRGLAAARRASGAGARAPAARGRDCDRDRACRAATTCGAWSRRAGPDAARSRSRSEPPSITLPAERADASGSWAGGPATGRSCRSRDGTVSAVVHRPGRGRYDVWLRGLDSRPDGR